MDTNLNAAEVAETEHVETPINEALDGTVEEVETPEESVEETPDVDETETPEESTEETAEEPDVTDTDYVERQANLLMAADADRFAKLQERFVSDEAFDDSDISWITEVTGLDEATTRYGLSLQREVYKAQQAIGTQSIAEAEAEVGSIEELIGFINKNAPEAERSRWQTVADFAKRTNDDTMTLNVLREMKAYKDSLPVQKGGVVKTLAHLASSQAPVKNTQTVETPAPTTTEPEVDEITQELSRFNSSALAQIVQNQNADAAYRSRARAILRTRGI